jgi:flagellar protein FliS
MKDLISEEMFMPGNSYMGKIANYKKDAVMTMSPGELVIKTYDECLKQLGIMRIFIPEVDEQFDPKKLEKINKAVVKVKRIVDYLRASLSFNNPNPEVTAIANNLNNLYDFFNWKVTQINSTHDMKELDAVIDMFKVLREGFVGANEEFAKMNAGK